MEKIYEERFQQLLEGFRHRVDMYDSMVENCDKRIDAIDGQIAALKKCGKILTVSVTRSML